MKWNMVFGALVVSVGLCSQSFGFELLDRMLGLNDCGCNTCCTSEPSCGCDKGCEPGCAAADASCCAAVADPGCGCAAAEPACGCAAEPACGCAAPCDSCCATRHCGRSKCRGGILSGLHGHLFGCCHKKCCKPACNTCNTCNSGCAAEPACGCAAAEPACGCAAAEPACAAPAACGCAAAEPACGCAAEPACGCAPACNSCNTCCKKRHHCGLLGIFHCHKKCCKPACNTCNSGCATGCAEGCATGCAAATGCASGCGAAPMGDAEAPAEDAAPMPPAPTADPSASVPSKRRVVAASSKIVRRS